MGRIVRASLLGTALVLLLGGCGDDATAQSCASDQDCSFGQVCVNSSCSTVECANSGDCESTQVCVLSAGAKVCAAAECGCLDCGPCPSGDVCVNGQCKAPDVCPEAYCPGKSCTGDTECSLGQKCVQGACWHAAACFSNEDCGSGEICEAKACRPCEGDECKSGDDCTVTGCEAGYTCDAASKTCVESSQPTGEACTPCAKDTDCGTGGWKCVPLGGSQVCLSPCGTGDDCPTGWTCFGGACSPAGFSCNGCVVDGCAPGEVCDTITGACSTPKALCDTCTHDWECGPAAACHKVGGARTCVPRCPGGTACSNGASCVTDGDSNMKVCEPVGQCCFDPNPANCGPKPGECTPACGGLTPHCAPDKVCVECLNSSHCADGAPCINGFCESSTGECKGATPYLNPNTNKCVQCLNTSHCPSGSCDTATGTCVGDTCATCVAPYPACTLVGGDYYCVQCTNDEHCGVGGTCNLQTYSCEGGTVEPAEKCKSDADCDPGISGFNLACDVASGYCYDKSGQCDDVTAFCLSGEKCVSLFEVMLGGESGMTIPPELLGGATIPGVCECTSELFVFNNCPEGVMCLPINAVFGGGDPSQGICVNWSF